MLWAVFTSHSHPSSFLFVLKTVAVVKSVGMLQVTLSFFMNKDSSTLFQSCLIIGENRDKSDGSITSYIYSPTDGNLQEATKKRVWLHIQEKMMAKS